MKASPAPVPPPPRVVVVPLGASGLELVGAPGGAPQEAVAAPPPPAHPEASGARRVHLARPVPWTPPARARPPRLSPATARAVAPRPCATRPATTASSASTAPSIAIPRHPPATPTATSVSSAARPTTATRGSATQRRRSVSNVCPRVIVRTQRPSAPGGQHLRGMPRQRAVWRIDRLLV